MVVLCFVMCGMAGCGKKNDTPKRSVADEERERIEVRKYTSCMDECASSWEKASPAERTLKYGWKDRCEDECRRKYPKGVAK